MLGVFFLELFKISILVLHILFFLFSSESEASESSEQRESSIHLEPEKKSCCKAVCDFFFGAPVFPERRSTRTSDFIFDGNSEESSDGNSEESSDGNSEESIRNKSTANSTSHFGEKNWQ